MPKIDREKTSQLITVLNDVWFTCVECNQRMVVRKCYGMSELELFCTGCDISYATMCCVKG